MKLVIEYTPPGEPPCGSCDVVRCVEYESAEAWLVRFEEALNQARVLGSSDFTFAGQMFEPWEFEYALPDVFGLEEWHARRLAADQ